MPDNLLNSALPLILLFLTGAGLAWILRTLVAWPTPNVSSNHSTDLVQALDNAPFLVWAEKNQTVVWQNAPHKAMANEMAEKGILAFEGCSSGTALFAPRRVRLVQGAQTTPKEFTLSKFQSNDTSFYYASDATRLVESEQELQRFIQTLTETFAHLPIGLAIFDKKRDLSLFNPALSGLLGLPAEWLIRRPSLMSFLDRLRNEGIMPEPDDFQSFRKEFKDLESGAVNGTYQAEWTLGSGRIYRVVGRPHIQGGLALLFEDISKSVMIERQYRAELEQLYSALECLADGIAIFDKAGELVFVNDAFDEMWHCELAGIVSPTTVIDFSRILQSRCLPTPTWGDFREFVLDPSERSQWQASVMMKNGSPVNITFSPIAGGQVFCEFKLTTFPQNPKVKAVKAHA